jgi:UDP-N-acetylglucosamine--N-acetylmuramyl-(pentapeptide) pyrophosphoryl-undecaprenol N-acetylglucosamine transferase
MRGVSTFIHESNAIPGKANQLTARMVRAVMLGFEECAPFFPKAHIEITGTPIRTELKPLDRQIARQKLGLRTDLATLLVMGGSQGASGINQAIIKSLPFLQGVPLQVIHLSGARDERLVADNYRREKIPAYIAAFIIDGGSLQRRRSSSWHAPARRVLRSSPLFRYRAF